MRNRKIRKYKGITPKFTFELRGLSEFGLDDSGQSSHYGLFLILDSSVIKDIGRSLVAVFSSLEEGEFFMDNYRKCVEKPLNNIALRKGYIRLIDIIDTNKIAYIDDLHEYSTVIPVIHEDWIGNPNFIKGASMLDLPYIEQWFPPHIRAKVRSMETFNDRLAWCGKRMVEMMWLGEGFYETAARKINATQETKEKLEILKSIGSALDERLPKKLIGLDTAKFGYCLGGDKNTAVVIDRLAFNRDIS